MPNLFNYACIMLQRTLLVKQKHHQGDNIKWYVSVQHIYCMATHDYQAVTRRKKDAGIMEQWNTGKMVLDKSGRGIDF